MKKLVINIFFYLLFLPLFANGQNDIPIGIPSEYLDVRVQPNNDTLLFRRQQTEWWFGLNGGVNMNMYFNDLNVPRYLYGYVSGENLSEEYQRELVDFPMSTGAGWFVGLAGEYMQPGEEWGIGLKIFLMDVRETTAETDPLNDTIETQYVASNVFNYITFQPSFRYNFPSWRFPGLHIYGGADIEVKTNIDTRINKKFKHTSYIDDTRTLEMDGENVRLGFHFGLGLDMFAGDIWNQFRGRVTPFVDVHIGTNILDDFGSDRNTIFARAGFSIRFSRDRTVIDTLKFDSTYLPPPMASADLVTERGITFSYEPSLFMGEELAVFEQPQVEEFAEAEEGIVGKADVSTKPSAEPEPQETYTIEPDKTQRFSYPTSSYVQLTDEIKRYLDAVANYMKTNPDYVLQLFGHSDNLGTAQQQEERAAERARIAKRYLMGKGIEFGRIFDRGDAARAPIGNVMTESGRRQNRRIEIVIRQR